MSDQAVLQQFAPLFAPKTVAVLGPSTTAGGPANAFIRRLRAFGFDGDIFPIHPSASEIEGFRAYPSLAETPAEVDYAYVAIAAERVPGALHSGRGRVRFAQVMSSGFGEAAEGGALQKSLLQVVRAGGMRLIGPNCLGTHSTSGRLTFIDDAEAEAGSVGILSQSGGLSVDMLRRGQHMGIRFSRLVTLGNCADVGPNELLDYLVADPDTAVIGLYLESIDDGRAFFERLKRARTRKPVVLLKGGRTTQGQRAAASHTGTLAADERLWVALALQTGTALVETLDEFLDTLLALQWLTPNARRPTHRVVLFGNGGGTSVLGTDALERQGFEVPALNDDALDALRRLKLPAGSSIRNPIDTPASALRVEGGRLARQILDAVHVFGDPDAVIMHLNIPVILGYPNVDLLGELIQAALDVKKAQASDTHFILVLRSDGDPKSEHAKRRYRQQAAAWRIPVFDEIENGASALRSVRSIEQFRLRHLPVVS